MRFSLRKKKPQEKPRRDVVVHVPTVELTAEALPVTVEIEDRVSELETYFRRTVRDLEDYLQKTLVPVIENGFGNVDDEFHTIAETRVKDRGEDDKRYCNTYTVAVFAFLLSLATLVLYLASLAHIIP